jgi:hypothetical protein
MSERSSDDPFAFEDEDDTAKKAEEFRKERDRLGKKLREAQKDLAERDAKLAEYGTKDRASSIEKAFTELKIDPVYTEFYTADDVTPEAIKAWGVSKKFIAEDAGGDGDQPGAGTGDGFNPVPTPRGAATSGLMSRKDWLELAAKGPEGAKEAEKQFLAGNVDLSEVYEGVGPRG